jgi:ribosomal-protein-alanine N-acetyltransferase
MRCVTRAAIRRATPQDIDPILRLEQVSNTAAHWSRAQYERIFQAEAPSRLCLVAESGTIQGFLVAQTAGPEWELENIVVAPAARRHGLGRELVRALLEWAQRLGALAVLLEVRHSNAAARALYQGCGFVEAGERPGYYEKPPENAVLYRYDCS